jgi:hypothetical protein
VGTYAAQGRGLLLKYLKYNYITPSQGEWLEIV